MVIIADDNLMDFLNDERQVNWSSFFHPVDHFNRYRCGYNK